MNNVSIYDFLKDKNLCWLSRMQVSFVTESRNLDLAFQQSKQNKSIWIQKHFSLASGIFNVHLMRIVLEYETKPC